MILPVSFFLHLSLSSDSKNLTQSDFPTVKELDTAIEALSHLHRKLSSPEPDDWLYEFKEDGQLFKEYISGRPLMPDPLRKTIYIQPLGKFTDEQNKILQITGDAYICFTASDLWPGDGWNFVFGVAYARYRKLSAFCGKHRFLELKNTYDQFIDTLEKMESKP